MNSPKSIGSGDLMPPEEDKSAYYHDPGESCWCEPEGPLELSTELKGTTLHFSPIWVHRPLTDFEFKTIPSSVMGILRDLGIV